MALKPVNAVVVGAGAGGGVVAKELSEAGLTVVLLERGGWPTFEQHGHDELVSQRTTLLGNAFRSRRRAPPGALSAPAPASGASCCRAKAVTTTTLRALGRAPSATARWAWRFMEKDFRMRSTYGAVAGSTLEDWPISYSDLEPFYEKAEWEIGVAGDMSANPFSATAPQAISDGAVPAQPRGRAASGGSQETGFPSVPGADAAQLRALRRTAGVHQVPLLRWLRVRGQRQVRHAKTPSFPLPLPPAIATCARTASRRKWRWTTTVSREE